MKTINRNFPWCEEYDDSSFTGMLNEARSWSDVEYFKLDKELYDLASAYSDQEQLPRELVWRVMRIFSYAMMTIGCHYNPNDGYKISNLKEDDLFQRAERLQLVFEGFFKGEMPEERCFEYVSSSKN